MQNIFSSINYKLLIASLLLLAIGYVLLGQGPLNNPLSYVVAPLVLIGVYCVLIPVAILAKGDDKPQKK